MKKLLLALCTFCALASAATNLTDVALNKSRVQTSTIDSTAIGDNVAASGVFTYLRVTNSLLPSLAGGSKQGGYFAWNLSGGTGETDFVNQPQGGSGGFHWWVANLATGALGQPVMTLDSSGGLTTRGAVTVLGAMNVNGLITGTLNGNAATASQFGANPSTCNNGAALGILANGAAICTPVPQFSFQRAAYSPAGIGAGQGAYIGWNQLNLGETDFVNHRGLGSGGWMWYDSDGTTGTVAAQLAASGLLTLTGGLSATTGTFSGAVSAASALVSGDVTSATVHTTTLTATNIQYKNTTGCTTSSGQKSYCEVSFNWTTAFADNSYTATCTGAFPTGSGAAYVRGPSITAKSAGGMTVAVTNMGNTDAAAGFGEIDCIAIHP